MSPLDQPRRLAPVLFAAFNIWIGAATFGAGSDHIKAYAKASELMSMNHWAIGLIVLGLVIPVGIFNWRLALLTEGLALGYWLTFAYLVHETLGQPGVSNRAVAIPVGIAALHSLLGSYRRRPRRVGP